MSKQKRVLLVDDDPTVRIVSSQILTRRGFHVKDAATVAEALTLVTAEKFDALVSDLDIGEPGDGFTVVSAMRRVQPEAVTVIVTGFPAFEAALRAIHEQVDDFLTKPTDFEQLVKILGSSFSHRKRRTATMTKRLRQIIDDCKEEIIGDWYRAAETDPELRTIPLSREERIDHLPDLVEEIVRDRMPGSSLGAHANDVAARHGLRRRKQGYTVGMLLSETIILHRIIAGCVQRNLLRADISNLVPDFVDIDDTIHLMLTRSTEAFLGPLSNAA
jgi:two-component system response regulator RegA